MDQRLIEEDLMILPGTGATMSVGSDAYAFYVSEALPKGVVGMYSPKSHFEKSWADGDMVVDPFDPSHETEMYIKRRYGQWWKATRDGKPIEKFTGRWSRLSFNGARSYRDPSF